ncbi:MAG: hypothetical protein AB7T37_15050 [Dehalococcoidia bacterium]
MIRGYFRLEVLPQPFVNVAVQIGGEGTAWVPVPFIIDTGAAATCVHALDAVRLLGIPPSGLDSSQWKEPISLGGIGGGGTYLRQVARFGFLHDDRQLHLIEGSVFIGDLATQSTPALLGWDILQHFQIAFDGNRSVTLTPLR